MELNHHIRLCRPFPFRFGFRALSDNAGIVTAGKRSLQFLATDTNFYGKSTSSTSRGSGRTRKSACASANSTVPSRPRM